MRGCGEAYGRSLGSWGVLPRREREKHGGGNGELRRADLGGLGHLVLGFERGKVAEGEGYL